MSTVRPPAVAGTFYSDNPQQLAAEIQQLLDATGTHNSNIDTPVQNLPSRPVPKALIVPHAGYIYSGFTAAVAYSQLLPAKRLIKRVVLLGPVHRVPVTGLALPGVDVFSLPFGELAVDSDGVQAISHLPQVVTSPAAHAEEHSLEVQLPFLQSVLADFTILPLAVGDASAEEVAEVLDILWGGDETLIIVSSDLSHFLPYQTAQEKDRQTVQDILNLHTSLDHEQACGGTPVNGFLLSAKRHALQPELLDLRNSGDTGGNVAQDKTRVVGYASFSFQ